MCGIAGLIHRGKSSNVGQELQNMLQALKHRGPDSTGYALYADNKGQNFILRFKVGENVGEGSNSVNEDESVYDERKKIVDKKLSELGSNILKEELAEETKERITKIDAYIQSNLEELDVEDFKLDAGISIRDLAPDEFEIESSEAIDDADLHEKIKTTTKAGYAFVHSNGRNVIRKAKITVYKKEVQDG